MGRLFTRLAPAIQSAVPTARARRRGAKLKLAPLSDAARIEQALQAVDAVHRLSLQRHDPVTHGNTRLGGGTSGGDVDDVYRSGARQIEMTHDSGRDAHVRAGHADVRATHAAMRKELPDDPLRRVDPGREANGLGLANHRRVDTDHPTLGIDQRAPGISRIERGIGLDHIVHQSPGARAQGAPQSRDHPGGHALRVSQRIADGDRHLADTQHRGVAEFHERQRRRGADTQHGKIRVGIVADEISLDAGLLVQAHEQPLGAVHDMAVGEQIAVGGEQKPGTGRMPGAARPPAGAPLRDFDEGDGRRDALQSADHGA